MAVRGAVGLGQGSGGDPFVRGDRVRLAHPSPILTLRSDLGTLSERTESGSWLVALDTPAVFTDANGRRVTISVVRESWRNLEPAP